MDDLIKEIENLKKENELIKRRLFIIEKRENFRKVKKIIGIILTFLILAISIFYFLTLKNSINEIMNQII